ncbi:hypothetical protein CLV62_13712 [Dysgonomonas alginatilytica]|uniref:Uncharacterized protein n=1 Tax=Dysgonomonas alginatilytica TaxID=1605892 RepID=A0A2V3PKW7_9BACT|nr:hypothetical protein CLV62_13712 [Dysgonomonas alginatilytica]
MDQLLKEDLEKVLGGKKFAPWLVDGGLLPPVEAAM